MCVCVCVCVCVFTSLGKNRSQFFSLLRALSRFVLFVLQIPTFCERTAEETQMYSSGLHTHTHTHTHRNTQVCWVYLHK